MEQASEQEWQQALANDPEAQQYLSGSATAQGQPGASVQPQAQPQQAQGGQSIGDWFASSGLGPTLGRVGAGALAGGALGSVVPGAGTIGGAVAGGLAGLGASNVLEDMWHQRNETGQVGTSPTDIARYGVEGIAPAALGSLPIAQGPNLLGTVARNAGLNAAVSGTADVAQQGLSNKPFNPGQAGGAVLGGAVGGAAAPLLGAGLGALAKNMGKAGGKVAPELQGYLNEAGQAPPSAQPAQTSPTPTLPPLGLENAPPEVKMLNDLSGQYALYRYHLPGSKQTQDLAEQLQKAYGVDPDVAADSWIQTAEQKARQNFAQNQYGSGQSETDRISQLQAGVQQQQGQNVKNSLDLMGQPRGDIQTPGVNQAISDQAGNNRAALQAHATYDAQGGLPDTGAMQPGQPQVGPQQPGQELMGAVQQGTAPDNTMDAAGLEAWLHSQQQQNLQLDDVVARIRAQNAVPDTNVPTPNADAGMAQQMAAQQHAQGQMAQMNEPGPPMLPPGGGSGYTGAQPNFTMGNEAAQALSAQQSVEARGQLELMSRMLPTIKDRAALDSVLQRMAQLRQGLNVSDPLVEAVDRQLEGYSQQAVPKLQPLQGAR